jgi:nucleoside-diphosphate-sugar epimerase
VDNQDLAVVTGASGCVGAAVAKTLLDQGWSVRGLVRRPGDVRRYEEHVGDLTDPDSLRGLCAGARLVVHAAANVSDWSPGPDLWRVNRDGTHAVLDEALRANVSRFVYVSTVDVFGFNNRTVINERSPKLCPPYPYSLSKLAGENLAWSYQRRGLDVTVIYPTWVFGPGDRHLIPELVTGVRDRKLVHFDHGSVPLELTYSENLAEAIVLAATKPDGAGERFIVGDSYGITVGRLIDLIAEQTGALPPRHSVPYRVALAAATLSELAAVAARRPTRPMLTRYAVKSVGSGVRYDLGRIKSIGYDPPLSVTEALRRTLDAMAPAPPPEGVR